MAKRQIDGRDSNDYRTYRDYISVGNVFTKPYLMISELIDNAIGSMDDNNDANGQWERHLVVDIEMDLSSKEKEIINTKEVFADNYIKVTDNAFGMSDDRLFHALQLNSKNEGRKSKMNVHGRGLKQSAFYFGVDLEVNTFNGDVSSLMKMKLSEQSSIDSKIQFITEDSSFNKMGTEVIISKIKTKSKLTPNSFEKKVLPALAQRYKKFLDKDMMTINYNISFPIGAEDFKGKIKADLEPMDKIATVFKPEKIKKVIELSRKQLDKKFASDNGTLANKPLANIAFEAIKAALEEAIVDNNKDFIFEIPINFNGFSIPVKFWMLEYGHSQYKGFRVYEGLRAILHGPITKDGTSTYMSWYDQSTRTGSTINRFAGEFDISLAEVKTKTDKSSFDTSEESKEDLDSQLLTVWEIFDIFVMQGRQEEKNEPGIGTSSGEAARLESVIKTKYKNETVEYVGYDKKRDLLKVSINIGRESWDFEIIINKKMNPDKIFESRIFDDEQRYQITGFTGHQFWKRIDKLSKRNFITELVHPMCLLMGIQELELRSSESGGANALAQFNEGASNIFDEGEDE